MKKINLATFDRIVSYGCSFTVGEEAIDHELLDMTFDECNRAKKLFKTQHDFMMDARYGPRINSNTPAIKHASWSNQLADRLGKKCVNLAIGGTSLDHHFYQILDGLTTGFLTNRDLIILGITSPQRLLFIKDNGVPESKLLHSPDHWRDVLTHQYIVDKFNSNTLHFFFYKTLHHLAMVSPNIVFQTTMFGSDPCQPSESPGNKNLYRTLNHMWDITVNRTLLPSEDLSVSESEQCRFGHSPKEAHTRLAESLKGCFYE